MSHSESIAATSPFPVSRYWRGFGLWNLYFIFKLALYWRGAIDFDALANLVFAAFLLLPLPPRWLHRLRHLVAIPIGVALFYHDTWLPPFERLIAQSSQVGAMSPAYLLELASRVVDWQWLGVFFVLAVGYGFVAPWFRVTVPVVLALVWLGVAPLLSQGASVPVRPGQAVSSDVPAGTERTATREETVIPAPAEEASDSVLDDRLQSFYASERERYTTFSARPAGAVPFDILFLNICSLSWDDIAVAGLEDHPLLDYLDVVFDDFNSATSYSGPAGLRLLQASCGQRSHAALYNDVPARCHLFENLAELGFEPSLVLNHDGHFDDYLALLQREGGLDVPMLSLSGLQAPMVAFDDSPVYRDLTMLQRWDEQDAQGANAVFYNTVTLHDGNRFVGQRGFADYDVRLRQLFDDLLTFLQQLEAEERRVAVFVVPEHGAALRGDRMQFPGMREIPNPLITHVPVGVKLIGLDSPRHGEPLHVTAPSSYLALSELTSRLVANDVFGQPRLDWSTLVADLPVTQPISENEGVVMMPFGEEPYIRLEGQGWMPYPQ
ncbi:cellulose biosynthesis protein BcsG [Halomonas organivorans]|uniref:Cellulose synthase operon protein YhjU n=1 Tax=Halomonas organivorans TaxID=257772 RepID=A0A7W5BXJ9_9GAMM|nr:cellulose biosynthesis protein BcsG [Halomonas organivorans]MBB3141012.1 cellulose synthase operon protein YhjU [Halomonas organivorans]